MQFLHALPTREFSITLLESWAERPALVIASAILGYAVSLGIYRLWFDALSSVPGPRLCAISTWPEFYYDVVLGGQYFQAIREMHEQYGPIVRINPNEVHCNDPDFLEGLNPLGGRKTNKPISTGKRTGTPDSMVTTVDHDIHRRRRNAVSAFFSNNSIRSLEPVLKQYLAQFLRRLSERKPEEPVQLQHMFRALTNDFITTYAFGESIGLLDESDFGRSYYESSDVFFRMSHLFGHFYWLADFVYSLPLWVAPKLFPSLTELAKKQQKWMDMVYQIRESPDMSKAKGTIFEGILNRGLPDEDLTSKRLLAEAQLIVFAGEGTTAYTLNAATYELLANPQVLQELQRELSQAIPDANKLPSFAQVEALPFLGAVIQETVRLHPGVMARQARISPDVPVTYKSKSGRDYVFPPGTVMSMSPYTTHLKEDLFQDAYQFRPQRWIDEPRLDRAFHGFARGSRNCVGMNLARREIALILAALFRKYNLYRGQNGLGPSLELYDTQRARDIDPNADYIIPAPAKGSKGLQVVVRH